MNNSILLYLAKYFRAWGIKSRKGDQDQKSAMGSQPCGYPQRKKAA
jgi:hypothetical protein